ncbi:MAG: radical SAM protein [Saezia sp.]
MEYYGLDHQGPCIRPPSEAYSILLQATLGCSHNKCTFCETFKDKRFAIKDQVILERDLAFAERFCRNQNRLFVMDGDAFIMPMRHWKWLLPNIATRLPWVERISTYANAKGVEKKSDADLLKLREMGLSFIYYGVESGHPQVLTDIRKGSTPEKLVTQARRLKDAGFTLSVTVMTGVGGRALSEEHAKATGEILTKMDPEYIGALTLMLAPGTPIYDDAMVGKFELPDQAELLRELAIMIEHTDLTDGLFMANHASNYLPIKAWLPYDKEETLARIHAALSGQVSLKPEWMRAL